MINCRLFLEKHFPHLAENFIAFTSPSVSFLVTQLDDVIKKLQLVHKKELPEVLVEIEFQSVSNLNESDVHALSNFVVAKTDILFCFRVLQTSSLSPIIQEKLQSKLDESFWRAVSTWRQKKFKPKENIPISSMLKLLFPNGLPSPTLTITTLEDNQFVESSLPSFEPPKHMMQMSNLLIPERILHKYKKYKLDKKDVLSIFPEEIITMIMACLDSKELGSFKQQLMVFKPEELLIIQKLFFSGKRQQDILKLLLPSGFAYLKICAAWVHTGLIPHWLNWLQLSAISELSFTEAVDYMQYFWLKIKDVHPRIPLTQSQMVAAPPQHAYPFQNRITDMLKLVDEVEPAFKKVQIESLFEFDWQYFEFYQTLLKDYHCFWIHPVMLEQVMVTRHSDESLSEANEVVYFQYISQHIQDKTDDALKSIYQYALHNRQYEDGELSWQMSAWCGSLPHVANVTLYKEVLDWVDDLSPDMQKKMVDALFAIPKGQRFQCEVFIQFARLVGSDANLMTQLLLFYRQWHSFPESTSESWGQLLNQLMYRHDEEVLLRLFEVGTAIEQKLIDSSGAFFKCLIILFFDEHAENLDLIDELHQLFLTLNAKQRLECLSILSSYEPAQQCFPLEPLRLVIHDIGLQQLSLEQCFSTHYKGFHFSYFKTVIDYQLVYQKMGDLIANIKESIHFFLSDDKIYGLFNIRSCMEREVHLILAKQDERLNQVSAELNSLKLKTDDIDLSGLFHHLKAFEAFFMDFIEWKLGRLFGENGVLLAGYGRFLSPVIHQLDKSLSAQSTLKQLMEVVLKKHDLVSQSAIGLHFKADMLQLLLEESNIPLMQRFLQKRLVNEIILKLDTELSQIHFPIADAKFKQLFNFLHELPLESEQVHFFFQRYQSIQYVVKVWPYIHHQLQAFHIDPDQVWDVCIKHQFEQGKPYSVAHWKIAVNLIELMLDLQQQTELPTHFSYLRFLDGFFKAKPSLAHIHLQGNGDIKHTNWVFLMFQMRHAIKTHSRNPMFLNLLPRAIEHILNEGTEFHFERHLEMMTKIGKNPEIFPRLMRLLNEDNPQIQDQLQSIFIHIGQLLELQDGRPWARLVAKLLNFAHFEMNLQAIEQFLVWIKQETAFNWVELIVDDERVELEDILRFPQLLQTPSLWVDVYQKQYLAPTETESAEPIVEQVPEVMVNQYSTRQTISQFWGWLNFGEASSDDVLEIEDDECSEQSSIASEDLLELERKEEWVSGAWKMLEMAPYASVRQIQQWLTTEPESVKQQLANFDCYPLGQIEPYFFAKSDMERWISKLEFYEFDVPEKAKIAERLTHILAMANRALTKSRTILIEEFTRLTQEIRKNEARKEPHSQDELTATIAAIYCKSTHRKPYPTQLLTLLLTLEYRARNIVFEVDTGEGKGITTALLAVLKWSLREEATIEIRTANQDLVRQDYYEKGHWRFFNLLGIHHAIIQKDSPSESYQQGGIYYSTHDDIHVFQECRRLAGFDRKIEVDVITDEVDSSILDQTSMINLAKPNHQLKDIHWIYAYINEFLDEALKLDKYSQSLVLQSQESVSPLNRSHSPVVAETFQPPKPKMIPEHRIKDWLLELGQQLKTYVIQHHKENIFRLNQIDIIHEDQWKDWLLVAAYASTLRENQHYVVEAVEHNGQKFHRVVPYMNGELKYGFELSFQMKPGLMQLLHARLAKDGRLFVVQPESQLISQLTINDFEHVQSFVGLSGSIGSLSELFDMIESTQSVAIRIPRYYESGLEELPALLMEDEAVLLNEMSRFVIASNHPVLLVLQRIEDASSLYSALKKRLPSHKHLRLLTGQESEEERRDWLHAKQSGLYAGSPDAVTVSTLICGRGTDISVTRPLSLVVKQIGILDPRNVVQIKGRTARVNNRGSFQVLYNKQALIHNWGYLCVSLPALNSQTLSIWSEKIQQHLIAETRNRCMNLRIKGWCQKHLIRNLERCFDHAKLTFQEKSDYYLMVSLALQQLGLEKHFDEDIVDKYIQLSLNIWKKILSKFEMDGYPQKDFSVASFHNSLVNDRDSWSSIVTKSISEEPVPSLIIPPVLISEQEIDHLIEDLSLIIPNKHFERRKDKQPSFWSWLYDAPELVNETAGFLSQTWGYLQRCPNQENWIAFYQSLCSAQELFDKQYRSNLWQFGYWFRLLNPLYDWLKVFHQVQLFVQKQMIISKQNDGFYLRVHQELMDIIPKTATHSVLWQAIYDWWRRAMSFFNMDIHQNLLNVNQAYQAFHQNPSEQTLNEFCHRLKDAELLFQEAGEWRSWRIGYWVYWHHQCQPWLELAKNMKQVIEDCNRISLDAQRQQHELDDMSHVKLVYRQHLLDQKSKIQVIPSQSIWSWFSSSSQEKHSLYEQVLKRTDIQKHQLIHYEIHELSLMYGPEIQELYKLFYPNSCQDLEDEQKPLYSLLLKVMSAYFNPLNSDKIRQEFAARPMTVLLAEIQRYSTRRELLVEWDSNKVLGNLLF
jgi:hypothetical protein